VQLSRLDDDSGTGSSSSDEVADEASTDEPDEAASASSTDNACQVLDQWLSNARERIRLASEMSLEDATLEDLDSLAEHAVAYVELAEDQLADVAPPEADAAGKALVATLQAYSGAIEQILGANEPGKDMTLELVEGMNTFNAAGSRIREIEEELVRIAERCD
jgi:hypothetical protein